MKRKRVLVPLASDLFVRNFVESGAMGALEREFEVHYLVSRLVKKKLKGHVHEAHDDQTVPRTLLRYKVGYLSMNRHRDRSRSFPIKTRETMTNHLSLPKRILFELLSLPVIYEAVEKLIEWKLGRVPGIDAAIREIQPEFALIPSGFSDSFSIDCLKSVKGSKIPHLLLMFNWDNVSCKGVLPVLPEWMGVWGEQTKEQAVKIHGLPENRVLVLGSPQFEAYRNPPEETSRAIRESLGFPSDGKLLLYLGIQRYRDETALLRQLEDAIESGMLPGTTIVYRPHPWRNAIPSEKNFFDQGFRHLVMDPQLSEHYQKTLKDPVYDPKSFVPSFAHATRLLACVDAVISSLTTMGIEAMMVGKPVLLPAFPDPKFPFSTDTLIQYEHHACWERFTTAIVCGKQADFSADCARLLSLAESPGTAERAKKEVQYVVHLDDAPYSERLLAAVKRISSETKGMEPS